MILFAFMGTLSVQLNVTHCTEREIALMQEYRTRLTADLVTGKLPEVQPKPAAEEALEEIEEVDTEEVAE